MVLKGRNQECTRDISWHPHYPIIASTSFGGNLNLWTIQNMKEETLRAAQPRSGEEQRQAVEMEEGSEDDELTSALAGAFGLGFGTGRTLGTRSSQQTIPRSMFD